LIVLYDISHTTTYRYASRVGAARCLLHLEPADREGQTVLSSAVQVEPRPLEMTSHVDFFGNLVMATRFAELPGKLVIRASSRVRVSPVPRSPAELTPSVAAIRQAAMATRDLSQASPVHMLFGSRHVPLAQAVADYAGACLAPDQPVLAAADELMRRVHADFAYDPESTDISTPIVQVMEQRSGVCQDFAHLMISALRGHGIPAAYVSGYLRTTPPPGRERLTGADATHAWISVWCGEEAGWVGLDPTNAVAAGEDHVVLAIGRDYSDVAPVSGVVTLSAGQHLDVEVDVAPVPEDAPGLLARAPALG
jgi:transglutaminase-like putative cysteine protease